MSNLRMAADPRKSTHAQCGVGVTPETFSPDGCLVICLLRNGAEVRDQSMGSLAAVS